MAGARQASLDGFLLKPVTVARADSATVSETQVADPRVQREQWQRELQELLVAATAETDKTKRKALVASVREVHHKLRDGQTKECSICELSLPFTKFTATLSVNGGKGYLKLTTWCFDCDAERYRSLPPDVRKLRDILSNAQKENKQLNALPPDFDVDSLRQRHADEGRCTLTGYPTVLAPNSDFMWSLDRYPDPKGPYCKRNTRGVIVEAQIRAIDGLCCLPEPEDWATLFRWAVDDLEGNITPEVIKAHVAAWQYKLRTPTVRKLLCSLITGADLADSVAGRDFTTNLDLSALETKLSKLNFRDEYTRGLLPIPTDTRSYFDPTLDRIVNQPSATEPANHSDINTAVSFRLLNSFGNTHTSGGICFSRRKFLKLLLGQTRVEVTTPVREMVLAELAA